jgi:CHAD domain-containing protein
MTGAVHDARVATRRVCELLSLMTYPPRAFEDLTRRVRCIGRALGRVRDSDVLVEFLASLETRVPHSARCLWWVGRRTSGNDWD